jgi:hypothetical protein
MVRIAFGLEDTQAKFVEKGGNNGQTLLLILKMTKDRTKYTR